MTANKPDPFLKAIDDIDQGHLGPAKRYFLTFLDLTLPKLEKMQFVHQRTSKKEARDDALYQELLGRVKMAYGMLGVIALREHDDTALQKYIDILQELFGDEAITRVLQGFHSTCLGWIRGDQPTQ